MIAQALPIDALTPSIRAAVLAGNSLVLEAPPGAGKTTRVPPLLLDCVRGKVLVLEPRRLAARLAARRVAEERGERLGLSIGYQVRFEEVGGAATRLWFLTEGVLTRRLLNDPALNGVDCVILDEFHERHLDGDLALALLLQLQRTRRPDLKLIVMSATLDADLIAAHLGGAPILRSEGRLFPIDMHWTPSNGAPLEQNIASGLQRLLALQASGDVLVFLPGAAEIRRSRRACETLAETHDLLLLELHGDLSPAEQDRVLAPASRRKVILTTNVAESSVTVEGVTAVIDSGLARVAVDDPWTGLPSLTIARISKASATQRAGRSARTAPGTVIRLYQPEEFARRPAQTPPEIVQRELSQLLLDLHAIGTQSLPWLTPPSEASLALAAMLLDRLGALRQGALTPTGRRMSSLPLHPRLARLVIEAIDRGAGDEGCRAAAVLSSGERLEGPLPHHAASDIFLLLERQWRPQTMRAYEQILRAAGVRKAPGSDEALLIAITAAFSDRLARRKASGELLLASGGSAQLADFSGVRQGELLVAIEMSNRLVRLASRVEPEWLLDLYPDRLEWREAVEWNRSSERVDQCSTLLFDGFVIDESDGGKPDPSAAAALLALRAIEEGIAKFVDAAEFDQLLERCHFAAAHGGSELTGPAIQTAIEQACYGLRSFAELRAALKNEPLVNIFLDPQSRALLDAIAPERLRLPSARMARIRYAAGRPPSVESRLQDFFGMTESPRIARGEVPLVVHLLAPNQRPVQMTQDLAGFWQRLYPQLRKELSRRYPRHKWPEDPLTSG